MSICFQRQVCLTSVIGHQRRPILERPPRFAFWILDTYAEMLGNIGESIDCYTELPKL